MIVMISHDDDDDKDDYYSIDNAVIIILIVFVVVFIIFINIAGSHMCFLGIAAIFFTWTIWPRKRGLVRHPRQWPKVPRTRRAIVQNRRGKSIFFAVLALHTAEFQSVTEIHTSEAAIHGGWVQFARLSWIVKVDGQYTLAPYVARL